MRFYSGISFKLKWRHLKWLAIPLFIILSYFSGAYGFIIAKAYTNLDTTYNIDIPNYKEQLEQKTCGNTNLSETFEYLVNSIDWDTSYYQMFVARPYHNGSSFPLRLYFKTTTSFENQNLWVRGRNNSNYFQISPYYWNYDGGYFDFSFNNCSSSLDVNNSQIIQQLINLIQNGTAMTTTYDANIGNRSTGSVQSLSFDYIVNYQFNNNSSYTIPFWYFYNSFKWIYAEPSISSTYFYKTLYFVNEDKTYTFNNFLYSYYDLHYITTTEDNNYFIGSRNSLGTIYTNFQPNSINNFNLDISFNSNINYISGYDYYRNIDFTDFNCYGRINHNDNYYSYEKFSSCTFELNLDNLNMTSYNDFVEFSIENLEIFDANDTRITDFSNYDKIFVYLDFQYDDSSLNTYVSNLEFNSSMNMLYLDYLKGEIFDDFDLPAFFKMFITNTGFSNSMSSNISVRSKNMSLSSNNFLYSQPYNTTTFEPTEVYGFISTNFQNLSVNNSQNIGYMIYHQLNNLNLTISPHIDMVLMRDIIISSRNISSNDFYYADDTGTITNNNIDVDYSYGVEESFGDISGLLPPGPLDGLLNIPFKYLSKTINSLKETCSPLSIPFVFDSELTFPCFDTYYEEFPASLKIFTEVVPCAFILIFYFKHLYKKISRATSLETTENDEWGCL